MRRALILILSLTLAAGLSAGARVKPIIGISSGYSSGTSTSGLSYVKSVSKAGGVPVIIPLVTDSASAEEVVGRIGGLIMTGGEDIDPAYYGEEILNSSVGINAVRDTSDMLLIAAAVKLGVPILGICRGEQIVNVYFGGSLFQDIPSQVNGYIAHRQSLPGSEATQRIAVVKGSRLDALLGVDSLDVNTFHHQAVKELADGLTANAYASDGVIEGYEGRNVFCVQFHPEKFVEAGDNFYLPIFEDFVKRASRKHNSHRK